MEVIKRKIATLKNDLDEKDEQLSTLRADLKHEKLEREKAENETSGLYRKVKITKIYSTIQIGNRLHSAIFWRGRSYVFCITGQ